MNRECVHCGLTYDKLRTGYTYQDIFAMFWSGNDDPRTWVNKRRNTILGRWHQIKVSMWVEHLEGCQRQSDYEHSLAVENLQGAVFDPVSIYQITANAADELPVPF